MSSEAEDFAEFSALFERMIRRGEGLSRFLPLILALAGEADEDGESTDQTATHREIVIDPVNRRVVMIRSALGEFLNGDFSEKQGRSPASKSSVESLPRVVIGKDEERRGSCPICLEEWSVDSMNSSHFTRHSSNREDMTNEEEEEESPTELNTINSSGGFLTVSPDKLSLKYAGVGQHGHDVGVAQSNKPAPFKRHAYYFEIYVKDAGVKGRMAIGFTTDNFKTGRHPGWELNTCGYHGEDGLIYLGKRQGEAFGPAYTTGDTVGAGINYDSQEFFFTVNGTLVGTVSKYIKGPLFPTVAVHSQNEEVAVNFGQEKFAFDFKGYEASERSKQQIAIEKTSVPPELNHSLVKNYLLHFGYEETFHAFDLATNSTVPPIYVAQEDGVDVQDTAYALNERKILRQLIGKGEIDAALAKLRDCYPQLVQDDKSEVCFLLHCQTFIELVRIGSLEEAVKYGRVELAKFIGLNVFQDIVEDCFALLVYERPEESNVGYFLEASQREVVADAVNEAILSTNPKHKDRLFSHLETLLRQLMACCLELRLLNDGQGESLSLNRLLENNTCKRIKKTG